MTTHTKLYSSCDRKHLAREETVIQAYRKLTGLESLPEDQEYWTLCGPLVDRSGAFSETSDLGHVLSSGLLRRASRAHGVERDPETYERNVQAVAQSFPKNNRPHIHQGELLEVLQEASVSNCLHPGLVNLDTLHEPPRAVRLLAEVLNILNYLPGRKMVVLNTIVEQKARGRKSGRNEIEAEILNNPFCLESVYHWNTFQEGYYYGGTGRKSRTTMLTTWYYSPYEEAIR